MCQRGWAQVWDDVAAAVVALIFGTWKVPHRSGRWEPGNVRAAVATGVSLANAIAMKTTDGDGGVRHNAAENRFEMEADGQLSVADYTRRDGEMVMTHTFVPSTLRGRGIAEKLVRAALEHARAEKLKVVPACSYVATFIERHAEFQSLLGKQ
jgi:uncharacterized protein